MPETTCKAKRTFQLAPNTEVTVTCGMDESVHMGSHVTIDKVTDKDGDVHVQFAWDGGFQK